MPFIKSEATKAALITLETQIQAASQRGATALSVYLENFCAKLLEIYYGYGFCNLNYEKKNVKGIDLYNTEYNHAIQITSERKQRTKSCQFHSGNKQIQYNNSFLLRPQQDQYNMSSSYRKGTLASKFASDFLSQYL